MWIWCDLKLDNNNIPNVFLQVEFGMNSVYVDLTLLLPSGGLEVICDMMWSKTEYLLFLSQVIWRSEDKSKAKLWWCCEDKELGVGE